MRMLLKAQLDHEKGNQAVKDGSLGQGLQSILDDLKPEAAYFYAEDGKRTVMIVFDMQDPSEIPPIAERFFMTANADVYLTPAMNADDLQKGLKKAFG